MIILRLIFWSILASTPSLSSVAAELYTLEKEIPLGGSGGWDFLSIDQASRRLYVAHSTQIEVIDLEKNQGIATITETFGVHGFAIATGLGKGFSSNGNKNSVSVVDLQSHQTLHTIRTGSNPDAIAYEPSRQEIYAFNAGSNSATVIDAKSERIVATIPLGASPEFAVADPDAARIYCNLADGDAVAVIDIKTHTLLERWPTAPGEIPYGMAFDPQHHRLFVGCRNGLLLMMDSRTGRVIDSVRIGKDVDANAFDPLTELVFASCGDGTVTIAKAETPEKLVVLQTLKTAPGAATMALDLQTHKIYLPAATLEWPTADGPLARQRPPKILPDTFKILVYRLVKPLKE